MRLNGASLNARGVNASRRLPVAFSGDGVFAFVSDLTGTRTARGEGAAAVAFAPTFMASATRCGTGGAPLAFSGAMTPAVSRCGYGAAVLRLDGALYFARTVYAAGELTLALHAKGDVGVKFGEGAAVVRPLEAEFAGTRGRTGGGAGAIALGLDFTASAIRYPLVSGAQLVASLSAALDPSHITGGGVRYVGMFGEAPVTFSAVDAGMLRQAHIGTMDIALVAGSATGTVRRPTLAGAAAHTIGLQAEFATTRRGQGSAAVSVTAECDGAVFVRGDGAAPVVVAGQFTARATRHGSFDAAPIGISSEGAFVRLRTGSGAAVISIGLSGGGARRRTLSGAFVIEALTFGDGITNPDAEDIDSQVFARPALGREFVRPIIQKEFTR